MQHVSCRTNGIDIGNRVLNLELRDNDALTGINLELDLASGIGGLDVGSRSQGRESDLVFHSEFLPSISVSTALMVAAPAGLSTTGRPGACLFSMGAAA